MSVKKLRIKRGQYFVTVLNNVAQGLSYNLELLGLYTYICSLPPDWEFHKSHLQKICQTGEKKLDRLFVLLSKHGLIEVIHNRDERGRFTFSDIIVNDGNSFENIHITPLRRNGGTVTAVRKSGTRKDIVTNDIEKKKKRAEQRKMRKRETAPPGHEATVKTPVQDALSEKHHKQASKNNDPTKTQAQAGKPEKRSLSLTKYPDDFFPDDIRSSLLAYHANRTNNSEDYLLSQFEIVSKKYKTRSDNWQQTFEDFLKSEKPKRTYEDSSGKKKRYHDDKGIYEY